MGRIRKKSQGGRSAAKRSAATVNASASIFVAGPIDFAVRYAEACGLAVQGRSDEARRTYLELDSGLRLRRARFGCGRWFAMIWRLSPRSRGGLMKRSAAVGRRRDRSGLPDGTIEP